MSHSSSHQQFGQRHCCLLLSLLLWPLLGSLAIRCRTGVDLLGGPVATCDQCLNTTSAQGQTVFSCDFGGICDTILNLRDGCMRDGDRKVCCCSTGDGCNFGLGDPLLGLPVSDQNDSSSRSAATNRSPKQQLLKSPASLHFLKKLESGDSSF